MKKIAICFSLFTNILFAQDSTLVKGIALPDLSVLYTNWDNKIVPFVEGEDSLILEIEGATATPKTWTADGCEYHGYYVNVKPGVKQVRINLKGLNQNLDTIFYGEYKYKVKPFPSAQIQTGTISKSSGTKVIVGLGADSPLTSVYFNIQGGSVDVDGEEFVFSGDLIKPALVKNAIPGRFVLVEVYYERDGIRSIISKKLKVTY